MAMFEKMHRNDCMSGGKPQTSYRLARIFDDTDSSLWVF